MDRNFNFNTRKNQTIKRVRFNTSQQWRLNRPNNPPNIKKAVPSRTIINKNLQNIKTEQTPLQRAQRAYYGAHNRSPLLTTTGDGNVGVGRVAASAITNTLATASKNRLPVHARLGNKKPITMRDSISVQLQKRQLALQKKEEQIKRKIKLLQSARRNAVNNRMNSNQINNRPNVGGMRSDQMVRNRPIPGKNNQRFNRPRMNVRANGTLTNAAAPSTSASDLTVSVANEAAVLNGLTNTTFVKSNNLPSDLNPRLQQEIALIQQLGHNQRTATLSVGVLPPAIPGLTVNPSQAIRDLNIMPVTPALQPALVQRSRMTLNDRFKSLKS